MSEFEINISEVGQVIRDETNRIIVRQMLNHNWTLVCVLTSQSSIVDSIEIHRKDTAGEVLVSGELRFCTSGFGYYPENFSQFFKSESSFAKIDLKQKRDFTQYSVKGFVKISHVGQIPGPTKKSVENTHLSGTPTKKSVEDSQLKSLELLSKDLEHLMDPASPFADVTLKCGGVSIPAYKNLLSARSPVFKAMFANPMKESIKNEVDITDIDESILRALLVYIYTGKTPKLTASIAAGLFVAADKYQLEDLEKVCSCYLKDNVPLDKVLRELVLGNKCVQNLKSFAMDNTNSIFSVLDWAGKNMGLKKPGQEKALPNGILFSVLFCILIVFIAIYWRS